MTLTARVILDRCRRGGEELRELRERIDIYREAASRTTSGVDGIGAKGGGGGDRMLNMVARIAAAEEQLNRRERQYTAEVACVCQMLETLPAMECSVLSRYYVHGQSQNAIARALGYSYSYVRGKKAAGLTMLARLGEGDLTRMLPQWYVAEDEGK